MKLFCIFLIVFYIPAVAQTPIKSPVGNDSLLLRIENVESALTSFKMSRDSLTKELYYYRQKEDLYIGLFDRYGGRNDAFFGILFAVIGIVFPLVGYFSQRKITREISKISKIHDRLTAEESRFNEMLSNVYGNLGIILYTNQALLDKTEGIDLVVLKINFLWESLQCSLRVVDFEDGDAPNVYGVLISSIDDISDLLEEMAPDELVAYIDEHQKNELPDWLSKYQDTILNLGLIDDLTVQSATGKLSIAIANLRLKLMERFPL